MQAPQEVMINGKTLPLWTRKQLDSVSGETLRLRGLDIKDAMGITGPVPRHKESLVDWVLQHQEMMLEYQDQHGMEPQRAQAAQRDTRGEMAAGICSNQQQSGVSFYQPADERYQGAASEMGGDDIVSYRESRHGAMAAKARNAGSGNILNWS